MVRCKRAGGWTAFGGIISLAQFIDEHAEALNFDLLTKTSYTLDDVGGALSWSALNSFVRNLDSSSALARDLGVQTGWENTLTTNQILADIYDLLQVIAIMVSRKKKQIKPYPRPGAKETRKFGKGALPVNDLHQWIKERQGKGAAQ